MENAIDKHIIDFIGRHHVLTIATSDKNIPWCASCFYAWIKDKNVFVYTTDHDTRHGIEALKNQNVAANIVLETRIVMKIQGLQISGITFPVDKTNEEIAKTTYLKRFPYARISDLNLWILDPQHLKLTNNKLGFGKKIIWQKNC
ncbi:MAG: pyridoxamine 5'-phosphate oxidase family protein [Salinivirgaceae bacterium]|jgi:uncharacterized protein YhbP (UPF0306 family)|nr:hypothetical protein [Bacteroidales bacterium]